MSEQANINEDPNNESNVVSPNLNINQTVKTDDNLLNAENQMEKSGEETNPLIKDENPANILPTNNETTVSTPEIIIDENNSKTQPQVDLEQPKVQDENLQVQDEKPPVDLNQPKIEDEIPQVKVVEDKDLKNTNNNNGELTFKVDKNTLTSLCQNLNSNLLVNIVAYIGVLSKLKDSETDEQKKTELENNITNLKQIQDMVSSLMSNVQANLDVPQSQNINPEEIIKEASKSTTLADQLISAQVTTILASLAAAAVLAGGKNYKKKNTKRKRNKPKKHTKKHH